VNPDPAQDHSIPLRFDAVRDVPRRAEVHFDEANDNIFCRPLLDDHLRGALPTRLHPQVLTITRISAFLQADGEMYHTYSTFGRGSEEFHNGYPYLDRAALGRSWYLAPATAGDRRYIDGGVRSGTNADLAAGADQILLITPTLPDAPAPSLGAICEPNSAH
jgi:hypothetical protein